MPWLKSQDGPTGPRFAPARPAEPVPERPRLAGAYRRCWAARGLLAVGLVAACALPARGQYIGPRHHVPNVGNRTGGYCAWASGETLARYNGYPAARGMRADRQRSGRGGPAYPTDVQAELARRGVPAMWVPRGSYVPGFPSMVSLAPERPGRDGHAVILQGVRGGRAYLYDPNFPGRTVTMPLPQFTQRWSGNALYIPRSPR